MMEHMKFTSCKADADAWMRPATKADSTEYYEYVLLNVDNCLVVISENPEAILGVFPPEPTFSITCPGAARYLAIAQNSSKFLRIE
jgi:hypothetical protein